MHLTIDRHIRVAATIVSLLVLATAPALAGGGREADASTPPEISPEATERNSGPQESSSAEPSEEGSAEESDDADAQIPMDEETARSLVALGMMPFQEKIPSEDFELALLGGGQTSLTDHLGSVVFLNFWATWCPPCREEMPSMQVLYDELRDEGLEILAVNVLESEETAQGFIDENGFTYPVLLDTNGRVMLRYGVRAYPTTYIVDREGHVIGVRPGFHDWGTEEIIAAMRNLLGSE